MLCRKHFFVNPVQRVCAAAVVEADIRQACRGEPIGALFDLGRHEQRCTSERRTVRQAKWKQLSMEVHAVIGHDYSLAAG
ncbi:hypothetical protein MPL3356_550005 [Mesorhizobium plurifarium]|uniref:Uncharacterized protein n=1 Tax=Mesorhizobium plurifarium TaxID=69974 RepID=A0A090E6T0_MESPL|nr:hypothetical protein MPL3356_550005 [Mesorhizobium plurifarium]